MLRVFAVAVLSWFGIGAVELKVDHVTVAGRDLGALQEAFDAVGIASEFGGKHTNGMTEMAIASFPDGSYLELIAPQPAASVTGHYWGRFLEQDGGACAWAISVRSLSAEAPPGIDIAPAASGRKRPDGVELRWTSASVGPGPQGSFFPFLIQDDTPRPLRVYPHGGPSVRGMEGIAFVAVAVRDLDSAIVKWRNTFGLPDPRRQDDVQLKAHLAWFAGTPVVLGAAAESGSWLAQRLEQFGEAPFAFILRAKQLPSAARSRQATWFDNSIGWFDPAVLHGARIGVTVPKVR